MAKRRRIVETKEEDVDGEEPESDTGSDRLSRLPDNIIGHIVSLLPTRDAFRTRRLCKTWFLAWASDPVLDFNDNNEDSVAFVDRTLLQINDINNLVQKFKLRQIMYGEAVDRMEDWLSFVAERNVKELDLDTITNQIPYTLSQTVLHSNSLTVLKLASMKLDLTKESVTLKSLKILSLESVKLDDESAYNIISSCSSLEQLDLRYCLGLKRLVISNPNLKFLEVKHLVGYPRIELFEAKRLKTFCYTGRWVGYIGRLGGDNGTMGKLSFLTVFLTGPIKDATSFEERISRLPCLEKLKLGWRGGAQQLTICNKKLRHLVLESVLWKVDVNVDAPNLISLEYDKRYISINSLNSQSVEGQ